MNAERASEAFRARQTAGELVRQMQAHDLPVTGCVLDSYSGKIVFGIVLPDGRPWSFKTPLDLLELETVEKMVRAYL